MAANAMVPRSAIVLGKKADPRLRSRIQANEIARIDYIELADRLNAEILDFATVEQSSHWLVKWVEKALGRYWALALLVLMRRKEFKHIYVTGEDVGIPLGLFGLVVPGLRYSVVVHNGGTPKRSRLLTLLGGRKYRKVFCLCTTQRQILTDTVGLAPAKVDLVNFCVDHQFYQPLPLPVGDYVLSVGIEQRDYDTLQRAAAMLPYEFRVVASGWSPDSSYSAASGIEAHSNIVVERNISSERLKELYARARFMVIPLRYTLYAAGITALMEAMAMGKAAIVSDAPGVLDYVKDGVSGFTVPVGDAEAMSQAITRLWEQPELAAQMGAHNRRWIEESFTIEQYVSSVADAMERAAGQSVAPQSAHQNA